MAIQTRKNRWQTLQYLFVPRMYFDLPLRYSGPILLSIRETELLGFSWPLRRSKMDVQRAKKEECQRVSPSVIGR
jgi:hypothetical protein